MPLISLLAQALFKFLDFGLKSGHALFQRFYLFIRHKNPPRDG